MQLTSLLFVTWEHGRIWCKTQKALSFLNYWTPHHPHPFIADQPFYTETTCSDTNKNPQPVLSLSPLSEDNTHALPILCVWRLSGAGAAFLIPPFIAGCALLIGPPVAWGEYDHALPPVHRGPEIFTSRSCWAHGLLLLIACLKSIMHLQWPHPWDWITSMRLACREIQHERRRVSVRVFVSPCAVSVKCDICSYNSLLHFWKPVRFYKGQISSCFFRLFSQKILLCLTLTTEHVIIHCQLHLTHTQTHGHTHTHFPF